MLLGRLVLTLILLALLFGAFYYLYLEQTGKLGKFKRNVRRATPDAEPVPAGHISEPLEFRSRGTFASDMLPLTPGVYKLEYNFPAGMLTSVRLINVNTNDNELLFVKSGSGSSVLNVDLPGRYVLQIEPDEDNALWQLDVKPLG